jgi:hypothetical protein
MEGEGASDAAESATPSEDGASAFADPYGGAFGCGAGIPAALALCEIAMPLNGGISGRLVGSGKFACTWGNAAPPASTPLSFGTYGTGPVSWSSISVSFTPLTPIAPGQPGPIKKVALLLVANASDGGILRWSTPYSCTLDLASDGCVNGGTAGEYALSGTGQCPDPAQPIDTTSLGAVDVGAFSFALEYVAPVGSSR